MHQHGSRDITWKVRIILKSGESAIFQSEKLVSWFHSGSIAILIILSGMMLSFLAFQQKWAKLWPPLTLQDYHNQLFGIKTISSNSLSQALCLPVSISELVEVNQSERVSNVSQSVILEQWRDFTKIVPFPSKIMLKGKEQTWRKVTFVKSWLLLCPKPGHVSHKILIIYVLHHPIKSFLWKWHRLH